MSRLTVILYAESHQPRGGYASMFRCVARLRSQQPHHLWYAAFAHDAPLIHQIYREAKRYSSSKTLIIPWTLERDATQVAESSTYGITTEPIGTHPLIREIFIHRANETHYLRHSIDYRTQQTPIVFVGQPHTAVAGVVHRTLTDVLQLVNELPVNAILQPLVLHQQDPLMRMVVQHTADGMALERFGVGQALDYDRRLLNVISEIVQRHH